MTRGEIIAELTEAQHTLAGFENTPLRTEQRGGKVHLLENVPAMMRVHYALKRRVDILRMLLESAS